METKPKKKSKKDVKLEVEKLMEEIKCLKEEAKQEGLTFMSLDMEELIKKESGETSESPYAYAFAWSNPVSRGGSGLYRMQIRNPDPVLHLWMHVTIFFGLGFIFQDLGQAWIGRDTNWPALSTPQFGLASGANVSKTLYYGVPSGIPIATYHGNSIFWKQIHPHGNIYYRGGFSINVV